MKLIENYSLKDRNTFHINVKADYWVEYDSGEDLKKIFASSEFKEMDFLPLGSGANILFTGDYHGLILHSNIKSINVLNEDNESILVRVGSGYNWDDFVEYAVNRNWGGIENLSGIPSDIGATAIQNIGAYGVEVSALIKAVHVFDKENLSIIELSNDECGFGYRDSKFKHEFKGRYIVCFVDYSFKKKYTPQIRYGEVYDRVKLTGEISILKVRNTILEIRNEKLPDPCALGNAGSFFKNPVISKDHFNSLLSVWPALKGWPDKNGKVKIPAAYCIEKAGWKGVRLGNAGVYEKQPLVIVNYGGAKPGEITDLAEKIIESVNEKFKIELKPEVVYI